MATGVIHTLGGGVQTVSMSPHQVSGGGFGQLATVKAGSTLAAEVKATYGGSVPITTIHATGGPTDYFHSSQHSHLLHGDNINKFNRDKGTLINEYDISRQELMSQGRLIVKEPVEPATRMIAAAPAITTMSAPMTYAAPAPMTYMQAPMTYGAPMTY